MQVDPKPKNQNNEKGVAAKVAIPHSHIAIVTCNEKILSGQSKLDMKALGCKTKK